MNATVHVIDDEQSVRDALVMLLEASGHQSLAYADATEFLRKLDPAQPGCVVADMRMPGMSGLDLLAHMAAERVDLPVIIITGHGDVAMAVRALKLGAIDFIEKPFDEDVLEKSVTLALDRGFHAFQERQALGEIRARFAELTPREREVMDLVVQGSPNKSVGASLGISVRTVEIHRARVMEKMEARSLSDLVRQALRLEEDGGI